MEFFLNKKIKEKTIKYIFDLIQLCSDLGGKHLIFGSPRNRLLHGKKYEECIKQIYEDFYKISEHGKKYQVYFCIEPLFDSENDTFQKCQILMVRDLQKDAFFEEI